MIVITKSANGINYARLATLKGMVTLESKGLKRSAGPIRPKIAAELDAKDLEGKTIQQAVATTAYKYADAMLEAQK